MENKVKDKMAKMLAEWLFKDFGLLIEPPSEKQIAKNLEKHGKKEQNTNY